MQTIALDPAPSLAHAVTRGLAEPVDAAAIACLPPMPVHVQSVLHRQLFAGGRPRSVAVHTTPLGRIALIVLPLSAAEVYSGRSKLHGLTRQALEEARAVGARVVSLTGLIPSATDLGRDVAPAPGSGLPHVTTGHATTVSAVVMTLRAALSHARVSLERETLACVGVGSIGSASLDLALRVLPAPARLVLCDLFSSRTQLERVAQTLAARHDIEIELAFSAPGEVSNAVYDARVVLGATNVPDVLDVARLRPGTVLVDDSAPHCFSVAQARARIAESGDLFVSEGGLVRSPAPLQHRLFLPQVAGTQLDVLISSVLKQQAFASQQLMGCVLSSALSATRGCSRTLGPVEAENAFEHYDALVRLGFGAPDAQSVEIVETHAAAG
jgi:hypothetical protein